VEFRKFLDTIEQSVPASLEVHLILDNYGTHKRVTVRAWFAKRPRFHVHFHSHQRLLDQSGGTLVCHADGKADPTWRSSQCA
jgi:hypothetical protein